MSKSPIKWGEAMFKIVLPMLYCVEGVGSWYGLEDQRLALGFFTAWLGMNYLYFVVGVCIDLSRALGIGIFTISR